jgi:hypothetical protein
MDGYSTEIEDQMVRFFDSLNERDRRRYAALEAEKLGHGGVTYISQLFSCDPKTIQHGKSEMRDEAALQTQRQRKKMADAKRRKLLRRKLSKRSAKS